MASCGQCPMRCMACKQEALLVVVTSTAASKLALDVATAPLQAHNYMHQPEYIVYEQPLSKHNV